MYSRLKSLGLTEPVDFRAKNSGASDGNAGD